jgi:AraC-like DNA-binding protein
MTLKEVALTLGKSESTLTHNFRRTQETLKKKGILLMKWGKGKDAEYEIEYEALD